MKLAVLLLTVSLMLMCTGCGTILMRAAGPGEEIYPATKGDIAMIHGCLNPDGTIFTHKSYIGAGLTLIDVPISLTTDTVFLPFDLLRRHDIRKKRADRQRVAADISRLVADIRPDPSVIFDSRWIASEDPLVAQAIGTSLGDTNTIYTAEILERLMTEAPRYKYNILANPRCPTHLLVESFQEAYDNAYHVSYEHLAIIVSNPNTPIELVEKVAKSQDIPVGAVYPARDALKRRKAEQGNGQPAGGAYVAPAAGAPSAHP